MGNIKFKDLLNENQKEQVSNIKYMIRDKKSKKFYVKGTYSDNIVFSNTGKIFPDFKKVILTLNYFKRFYYSLNPVWLNNAEGRLEKVIKDQVDMLNNLEIVEVKVVEDVIEDKTIGEIINYVEKLTMKDIIDIQK